jgi:protein tyrosine/serine phosphatase
MSPTAPLAHADIARFIVVTPQILRGAQPVSAADYDELTEHGVRTLLDLRQEKDVIARERDEAIRRGWEFVSIPMSPFTSPSDAQVIEALRTITDPRLQPVFVHCQHGKDRTGLVIGLYRELDQGWTQERAYTEMREIGFNPILLGLDWYFWHNDLRPEDVPHSLATLPDLLSFVSIR